MKAGEYMWEVSRMLDKNGKLGPDCWRPVYKETSKYTPHQGKQECARRRLKNE